MEIRLNNKLVCTHELGLISMSIDITSGYAYFLDSRHVKLSENEDETKLFIEGFLIKDINIIKQAIEYQIIIHPSWIADDSEDVAEMLTVENCNQTMPKQLNLGQLIDSNYTYILRPKNVEDILYYQIKNLEVNKPISGKEIPGLLYCYITPKDPTNIESYWILERIPIRKEFNLTINDVVKFNNTYEYNEEVKIYIKQLDKYNYTFPKVKGFKLYIEDNKIYIQGKMPKKDLTVNIIKEPKKYPVKITCEWEHGPLINFNFTQDNLQEPNKIELNQYLEPGYKYTLEKDDEKYYCTNVDTIEYFTYLTNINGYMKEIPEEGVKHFWKLKREKIS